MGKYFLMREGAMCNKLDLSNYGLVATEEGYAIDPRDNSLWKRKPLYDFGYGSQDGYMKVLEVPLTFSELIDLVLNGDYSDSYGSSVVIIEEHGVELLEFCENMFLHNSVEEISKMIKIFNLTQSLNRCPTLNKSFAEIDHDHERWIKVAEQSKLHSSKYEKKRFSILDLFRKK